MPSPYRGPVYSKPLALVKQLTPADRTTIPVPQGFTVVLRDIDVWSYQGVSAGNLYLYDTADNLPFWFCAESTLGGPTYYSWRGRQVFEYVDGVHDGFQFGTDGGGTNTYYIRASGYHLSVP